MRIASTLRAASRAPLLQVLKTSAAVIGSWYLTTVLLGEPQPIFAAIAALLVVQPSLNQSLSKGLERSLGVILGVLLAYGAGMLFGRGSWVVLSVIVLALLISWALRLGPGSANQIPISAMLVLSIGAPTPDYAIERVLETIIGAITALVVNAAIVPPVALLPAHTAVRRLLRECALTLERLAESLTEVKRPSELNALLEQAQSLRKLRDAATEAIATGQESLMLNPRRGKHRRMLERDEDLLARLMVLVTRILGMIRALRDHYDETLAAEPIVKGIGRELTRAAHDLRLIGGAGELVDDELKAEEPPALTAPLHVPTPHPTHWILIGSLLEDVRRVREVIIGKADD